jgi:NhaP-type Na+/H+ or K+/H+ antiporter
MEPVRKTTIIREWALFALSFGLGGHIALGMMLHTPELWPWDKAGIYGLLVGLSVYVAIQVLRSIWWVITESRRGRQSTMTPHH